VEAAENRFKHTHLSCPSCEHNGCFSINEDGSGYCFSCKEYTSSVEAIPNIEDILKSKGSQSKGRVAYTAESELEGMFGALSDRGITEETAKKFGVKIVTDKQGKVVQHIYPYFTSNEITASKTRYVDQKFFSWKGSPSNTGLFGQQIASKKGKFITIVEGECDAMAAYELLGSKWPVVSIKSGAAGAVKDVKESLEFLEGYEHVVLAFDNDKPGRQAARQVARILKPGSAMIMSLPDDFKDPNEMLKKNAHTSFIKSFWEAKIYTPSGVLNVSDSKDKFKNRKKKEAVPYPWRGLNDKLYGLRQGELVTLTGGTGLGKSSVTREIEHWLIKTTQDNVGIISLEEDWRRTVDGILSIEANARLYIDQVRDQFSEEEIDRMFDILYDGENKNRVWIHAHFGTNDIDEIFSKLRFMIVGCDCKWVVVDHLHMLVSSLAGGDERRSIDNIMTRLRSLVEETGAGLILVSHLRRVEGNKGHENGVETSLSHLRGSQSIAQLSDCVISLERNQQSDDPIEANTTKIRVLKSRYTGDVGIATHLVYDKETGRLDEISLDDIILSADKEQETALNLDMI
jgi:twinkle protein